MPSVFPKAFSIMPKISYEVLLTFIYPPTTLVASMDAPWRSIIKIPLSGPYGIN